MIAADYFAGAGGWTTGAVLAGLHVVAAVNHWRRAVETHAANHPETQHYCQDAALLDPASLPGFDTLIGSPECRGHSPATGGEMPGHDASRATAWCIVNTAEVRRPRRLFVENVPAMRTWALYPRWRGSLEDLGYDISENILNAADFGVPQDRVRLFVVGVLRGRAPRLTPPVRLVGRPRAAREIIDFDSGEWSPVAGHVPATIRRIEAGRRVHGRRFLTCYYKSGSGKIGRSLDRPIGTITCKARWAVIDGDRMRMLTVDELRRAMGFPDGYVLTGNVEEQIKQLGNAVPPPLAAGVLGQALGRRQAVA